MTNRKPGFGHIEDTGPSDRERTAPRFTFRSTEDYDTVFLDKKPFVRIKIMDGALPKGFQSRLFQHVADLLTGRKTALWDEQAVYGKYSRDHEHSRVNGGRHADAQARQREQK